MAIRKVRKKKSTSRRRKSARTMRRDNKGRFLKAKGRKTTKRKGKRRSKRRVTMRRDSKGRFLKSKGRSAARRKGKGKGRRYTVGVKRARRARRGVLAVKKYGTRRAKKFARKYKMKSNPGAMIAAVKSVLPIAASFYGSKLLSAKLSEFGPVNSALSRLPMGGRLTGPVVSGVVLGAVHFGTKKGALSKHRGSLMAGAAFALVDSAFSAFAPPQVASMFGVQPAPANLAAPAAAGEYFPMAQDDYVAMGEYTGEAGSHEVWGVHGVEEDLGNYGSLTSGW